MLACATVHERMNSSACRRPPMMQARARADTRICWHERCGRRMDAPHTGSACDDVLGHAQRNIPKRGLQIWMRCVRACVRACLRAYVTGTRTALEECIRRY
jgi:hypothetical protein